MKEARSEDKKKAATALFCTLTALVFMLSARAGNALSPNGYLRAC
jgi:hypothetical protein